jgi:predicted DNA repair protein MutK
MPGASLFTLLDDLAVLLDDVAVMTKVATKKTAGVLGDDLALNAEQVSGVTTDREWPVVWAVATRSLLNKAILVPCALALSAFLPWLVQPVLMLGGAYLCFEGAEKLLTKKEKAVTVMPEAVRIRGAVRTDFILSAEIIVIALGSVADAPLLKQFLVLASISLLMTLGVYGLVGAIVKLDDVGLSLTKRGGLSAKAGRALVALSPWLMKGLALAGTVAMFLVGGGILSHGVSALHQWLQPMNDVVSSLVEGALANCTLGEMVQAMADIYGRYMSGPEW